MQHCCVVGISLLSGLTSGISLLGSPGWGYHDGIAMMIGGYPAAIISTPIIAHVIIPFYSALNVTTCYSYLERRFSRGVRTTISLIFILKTLGYLGLVLYAPALALSTVTNVPIYATIAVCGGVATAYTIKGGMRSVVWVDFVQSLATIIIGYAVIGAVISSLLALSCALVFAPRVLILAALARKIVNYHP